MSIRHYAQRLLNPFRGVMNVIEYQGAEAVTTDGVHWDIYVRDTELVEDISDNARVQTSDIRYGHWSLKEGLKRGALYPSDDFKVLEHRGAIVYEDLLLYHDQVPFPLQDYYELWLLDDMGLPLALLDSAAHPGDMDPDCPVLWRAGQECHRRFRTPAMDRLPGAAASCASTGEYLTRYINSLTGERPRAQWFLRLPDGSGEGLLMVPASPQDQGRRLPAESFPRYFLREELHLDAHEQLVRDFIEWQAPWLLLLDGLSLTDRSRFERMAQGQALHMDRQHRLYPVIVHPEVLAAARVEARLRNHGPEPDEEEDMLSTYYIELNVTRTN